MRVCLAPPDVFTRFRTYTNASAAQLELDSADAPCALDVARSEADQKAERRILDSMRLTSEQTEAVQQVQRPADCALPSDMLVLPCLRGSQRSCHDGGRAGGCCGPSVGKSWRSAVSWWQTCGSTSLGNGWLQAQSTNAHSSCARTCRTR